MIDNILIDMDGVVADWCGSIMSHRLCEKFSEMEELNKHPTRQLVIHQIYEEHPDFFEQLGYIEEFTPIMEVILESGIPFAWATATGDVHKDPQKVGVQKQKWLMENIVKRFNLTPDQEFHLFLPDQCKSTLATPSTLLIDDYKHNTAMFELAGGQTHLIDETGYHGEREASLLKTKLTKGSR